MVTKRKGTAPSASQLHSIHGEQWEDVGYPLIPYKNEWRERREEEENLKAHLAAAAPRSIKWSA